MKEYFSHSSLRSPILTAHGRNYWINGEGRLVIDQQVQEDPRLTSLVHVLHWNYLIVAVNKQGRVFLYSFYSKIVIDQLHFPVPILTIFPARRLSALGNDGQIYDEEGEVRLPLSVRSLCFQTLINLQGYLWRESEEGNWTRVGEEVEDLVQAQCHYTGRKQYQLRCLQGSGNYLVLDLAGVLLERQAGPLLLSDKGEVVTGGVVAAVKDWNRMLVLLGDGGIWQRKEEGAEWECVGNR
jgi:hypothetical protein